MPIKISAKIKSEIIDTAVRNDIENLLVTKAAGKCFLCCQTIDSRTEIIEADHDIPRSLQGPTDLNNLNLVHESCNKFKRDNDSLQIKRFLPFRQYLIQNPSSNYDTLCNSFLHITHRKTTIEWNNNSDQITLKDGTASFGSFQLYQETIKMPNREIYYIFTKLPLYLIFNDNVQPRSIKSNHVFNLFQDLHFNPLHEPIGARLESPIDKNSTVTQAKILMFDGQHKAIANAILNAQDGKYSNVLVDVKLYLNFERNDAVQLVNSIQSKIIKLGLTKSEFANKMGEEWKDAFQRYEMRCQQASEDVTELGFVSEKGGAEKKRRLEALIQARFQQILNDNDTGQTIPIFELTRNKLPKLQIKETTFYNRIMKQVVCIKPTKYVIDNNDTEREIERTNIRLFLNLLNDELFTIPEGTSDTKLFHNFTSQSALNLILTLATKFIEYQYRNSVSVDQVFFQVDFETRCKSELEAFIRKFRDHPIWKYYNSPDTAPTKSTDVIAFFNCIKQNQSLILIAHKLNLNNAYCMDVNTQVIL
jgi:hypothetical protein